MMVYTVEIHGVHIQDSLGVYSDKKGAVNAAIENREKEEDNYHSFFVFEMKLDNPKYKKEVWAYHGTCND